jgi:GNAT superfamily N-acetyltransferase
VIASALAEHGLPFEPEGRDADVRYFGARAHHDDFVAEIAGRIVGVASVGPHGDEGVAWVSKVFVAKDARGRGLGRGLLRACHEAARARGYTRVGLRTRTIFREALGLYAAEGYEPREGQEALVGPGDVVLFRDLTR